MMKIITAVTKANNVVAEDERITPMQIRRIAESVENSCLSMNRALSVEGDPGPGRGPDHGARRL